MKKDELKILLPEERLKLSTGETISIPPVSFGKLRCFSDAFGRLIAAIQKHGMDMETMNYHQIFDVAFDEIVAIMSLVLKKDRAWFDTISIADGLAILTVIVTQNLNSDAKKNLIRLIKGVKEALQTQSSS